MARSGFKSSGAVREQAQPATSELQIDRSSQPKPNVKLAGDATPLGAGPVTIGMATIGDLPDEQSQREGFYFAEARQLVLAFPGHFKLLVDKG